MAGVHGHVVDGHGMGSILGFGEDTLQPFGLLFVVGNMAAVHGNNGEVGWECAGEYTLTALGEVAEVERSALFEGAFFVVGLVVADGKDHGHHGTIGFTQVFVPADNPFIPEVGTVEVAVSVGDVTTDYGKHGVVERGFGEELVDSGEGAHVTAHNVT